MSRIRTSLHAHPKLLLTLTAAGSAVTAAVITLSGASAGQLASSPPAAAQGAAHPAAAAAPATFRPIATLDAAATSQRVTACVRPACTSQARAVTNSPIAGRR